MQLMVWKVAAEIRQLWICYGPIPYTYNQMRNTILDGFFSRIDFSHEQGI